eukprot:TRINITY_DN17771_c0_g1_i1.p1 TRINITY_DN17771_c0_g1~~TRINITY_DN17771_c0_g1_i1.p1  ORF type:complete len:324 (+),score=57.91 TRINITY_DN17771_c0_g1_i1:49-972(+)
MASSAPCFGSADYWEEEYAACTEDRYDWLCDWEDIGWFLCETLMHEREKRILHIGSGTSTCPEQLHSMGYTNQIATDIALTCIDGMKAKVPDAAHIFVQADACDLQPRYLFSDGTFDLVFEKSVFDALECDDDEHAVKVLLMMKEVHRVLKMNGGIFLMISMHNPETVDRFLVLRCFDWKVTCIPLRASAETKQADETEASACVTSIDLEEMKRRYLELSAGVLPMSCADVTLMLKNERREYCEKMEELARQGITDPALKRSVRRQHYHFLYICKKGDNEMMDRHWLDVYQAVLASPDSAPSLSLSG